MLRRAVFFSSVLLLLIADLYPIKFAFAHEIGESYRVMTTNHIQVFLGDALKKKSEVTTRTTVKSVGPAAGDLEIVSSVVERDLQDGGTGGHAIYVLSGKQEASQRVSQLPSGRYLIPRDASALVEIPVFPSRDLKVGDKWTSAVTENIDFAQIFKVQARRTYPLQVHYVYKENKKVGQESLPLIDISYTVHDDHINNLLPFARALTIKSQNSLIWDQKHGTEKSMSGTFSYDFTLKDGSHLKYKVTSDGKVLHLSRPAPPKTIDQLKKTLPPSVKVHEDSRGTVITLDNLHFKPGKDELLDKTEEEKLSRIIALVGQQPFTDLLVVGHTAHFGTKEQLKALSLARAQRVAKALGSGLPMVSPSGSHRAILTQGKGDSEMIASDDTKEGQEKNRRVEIVLLH